MLSCQRALGRCLSRSASGPSVGARLPDLGHLQGFHRQARRPLPSANHDASSSLLLPKSRRHSLILPPIGAHVKPDLDKLARSERRFIVYRTTYADNEAWARFKKAVDQRWSEYLANNDEPDKSDVLEWRFVEDQGTLDGASKEQLRARFKAWAAEAVKTASPGAIESDRLVFCDQTAQFRFFVQVDEEALRDLVDPDLKVSLELGHVNFIDSEWEPDPEDDDGDYEPVEGYTGENVGWFKMAPDMLFGTYVWGVISGSEYWWMFYERPPEMRFY